MNVPRLFKNPYSTNHDKPVKRLTKRRRKINKRKKDSPGVPPNTCPYIDLVITMIKDLGDSYERLYTKGEHNPVIDKLVQQAEDVMEYVRANNETLRDNSAYWYGEFKREVRVKKHDRSR